MRMLDKDIHECKALVIDGNPTSRSILVAQLRDFGVGSVVQCGRIHDARRQLDARSFDIVLCEQSFHGTDHSGQQLLEDLRRAQQLPLSTVFVMITSEASYEKVTEAAESALDSYLLKPHTASALGERLRHARRRKRVLRQIFDAVEEGRYAEAAELCLERFRQRGEFWLFAARIGTEVMLNLGRHREAQEFYNAVLGAQAVPWARLGIARTQIAAGEVGDATYTLESLIHDQPTYVDAYDVMGRVRVEQGDYAGAAEIYRQSIRLTPGSVSRLQKLGMLSYYLGDREESARMLERAVSMGMGSKLFDFQSLVMLAFTRYRQGEAKGLQRYAEELARARQRTPDGGRLERFEQVIDVLQLMLNKRVADASQQLRRLAGQVRDETFDLEAACNLLSLLAELNATGTLPDGAESWVDAVALRHGTSKALTELLARTASAHPPFSDRVKACHQRITQIAEGAMAFSLAGDPGSAVRRLLEQGRATLNTKLFDNARSLLQRHHAKIADAPALAEELEALRSRYGTTTSRLALGEGNRTPGALALRTPPVDGTPAPPAAAAAVTA